MGADPVTGVIIGAISGLLGIGGQLMGGGAQNPAVTWVEPPEEAMRYLRQAYTKEKGDIAAEGKIAQAQAAQAFTSKGLANTTVPGQYASKIRKETGERQADLFSRFGLASVGGYTPVITGGSSAGPFTNLLQSLGQGLGYNPAGYLADLGKLLTGQETGLQKRYNEWMSTQAQPQTPVAAAVPTAPTSKAPGTSPLSVRERIEGGSQLWDPTQGWYTNPNPMTSGLSGLFGLGVG